MTDPADLLPLLTVTEVGRRPVTCAMCGRRLTGRAARLRGLGDGCRAKLDERAAPRPGGFEVEQDAIPGV